MGKREDTSYYQAPKDLRRGWQEIIEYYVWGYEWKAVFDYSENVLFSKIISCLPILCRAYLWTLKTLHATYSEKKDWHSCISVALYSSVSFFLIVENNKPNLKLSPKFTQDCSSFHHSYSQSVYTLRSKPHIRSVELVGQESSSRHLPQGARQLHSLQCMSWRERMIS